MSIQTPGSMRYSYSKGYSAPNLHEMHKALVLLAQRQSRLVIGTPAALTDNSSGSAAGGAIAAVAVPAPFAHVAATADLAQRAAFNTAIGKHDNALAVLAKYLNDSALTPLAGKDLLTLNATGVVAVAGTIAAVDKTVTATTGEADKATGLLTFTGQPANGETVTVGGKVYTFQTALTNVDGNVFIGASTAASVTNLINAITLGAGAGASYAAVMTANANVTASQGAGTTMNVTALVGGTAGNAIATTETVVNASFSGATLSGGAQDAALSQADAAASIQNLLNNYATVVKAYNHIAWNVGAPTLNSNSGGKADVAQYTGTNAQIAGMTLYDKVAANTAVLSNALATAKVVSKASVDAALTAMANNIAYLASQITGSLFSAATLGNKASVTITP